MNALDKQKKASARPGTKQGKNHSSIHSNHPLIWGLFVITLSWFACDESSQIKDHFRPAADFETQHSVMFCWNRSYQSILLPMIKIITEHDHVTIFYNENRNRKSDIELALLNNRSNIENISLIPFKLEKDNVWIRDFGPILVQDKQEKEVVLGFRYPHLEFTDYDSFSEQFSHHTQIPFYRSEIFSAGGGREINGQGTILLVETYEKMINPTLSKQEIEQAYLTHFHQKKVIWLKKGIPQDDFLGNGPIVDNIYGYGVGGHIDEFCRFIDPNTILLTEVDAHDIARDTFYQIIHDRMEENYRILVNATDQDGRAFTIIRLPQAPVLFADGKLDSLDILYTPVTSYLNFVITNNSVIIPSYYQAGDPDYIREKDEQARKAFQSIFPTREIHSINTFRLNQNGGGLHCITMSKFGGARKTKKKKAKRRLG